MHEKCQGREERDWNELNYVDAQKRKRRRGRKTR